MSRGVGGRLVSASWVINQENFMNKRLILSLIVFVFWVGITVIGGRIQSHGDGTLDDIVTHGLGWQFVAASMFLLTVVLWQRWNDVGLQRPNSGRSLWLAWLPMVYIVLALALALVVHLPPLSVLGWVLLNTAFVGFSEELMFRGVLFQAFRHSRSIWPAVLLSSFLFGAVHSLNVFMTGNLQFALIQSGAAFLSGLIFIALRLRTGSLWPSIVVHALWDFAVFTLAVASKDGTSDHTNLTGIKMFFPILFVLPNAVYGLWLIRHISKTHRNPEA